MLKKAFRYIVEYGKWETVNGIRTKIKDFSLKGIETANNIEELESRIPFIKDRPHISMIIAPIVPDRRWKKSRKKYF